MVYGLFATEYYLEDIIELLNYVPVPSDRKKAKGKDDDDATAGLAEADDDVNCVLWLFWKYILSAIFIPRSLQRSYILHISLPLGVYHHAFSIAHALRWPFDIG